MNIIILVQDYPSINNRYAMNYVHTRNLEYLNSNLKLTVLSFSAQTSYNYEGVDVLNTKDFERNFHAKEIDLVISHAPNIRNHFKFLKKYDKQIKNIIMFIHGHEVMRLSKQYPAPYSFVKSNIAKEIARDLYDIFKLKYFKKFSERLLIQNKLTFIFVSEWMRDVFLENIPLDEQLLTKNSSIIPNSMNSIFLQEDYHLEKDIKADFVTIRPLDNSKYAIDLVVALANKNPNLSFHIYGKGDYFKYNAKPNNITVYQEFFTPNELADILKHYRCALLPTRLDAQGVLMCEIATFGMPLVTSDLPICREMLHSFENIFYFNNKTIEINLNNVLSDIKIASSHTRKQVFANQNTIHEELNVINTVLNK